MKFKIVCEWFDGWFGLFWDRRNKRLYAMVPMIGFYVQFGPDAMTEFECGQRYERECFIGTIKHEIRVQNQWAEKLALPSKKEEYRHAAGVLRDLVILKESLDYSPPAVVQGDRELEQ